MRISANLGLLFTEFPLEQAVAEAAAAGFGAVEAQWPYGTDAAHLRAALDAAELDILGINAPAGDRAAGEFGFFAVPGRQADALAAFDLALTYAEVIGCRMIHALAGRAEGATAEAHFVETLKIACERAARQDVTVLIEPISRRAVPGYFLNTVEQAAKIVAAVGAPNLKIMFDCFHQQIEGGDLLGRFRAHRALIAHVQFAAVPDRGAPDHGDVDYSRLLPALQAAGYDGAFGAEYIPPGATGESLAWLVPLAARLAGESCG